MLLHGWRADHTEDRHVVPLLGPDIEVVAPELRGWGRSDRHHRPADGHDAPAQARSIAGLLTELGLDRPVVAGYDIGSRIAQALAASNPESVRALVLSLPLPRDLVAVP